MSLSVLTWGAGLNLDGIMMVKGMSMTGARVIILGPDRSPRVLTEDLAHFTLRLELNTEYLLSFEREGCVSKQLQFNTSVPVGYPVGEGFYFPFQVTLEPLPKGQHFAYAGPVGSIHFDKYINAFGYDTDYRAAKDEVLTKRLELARTEIDQKATGDMVPAAVAVFGRSEGTAAMAPAVTPVTAYEVIAPTVSRTAPMVHVLETPEQGKKVVPSYTETLHVALEELRPSRPGPELLALGTTPEENKMQSPAAMPTYRWKDVKADRLHVITTIKTQEEEREVEYRRVVSYFGGVTYFRNGQPCSQVIYQQGIDR